MALIKCPECGKEVSSNASNCPNCGHPIAQKERVIEKTVIKEKKKGSCLSKILMAIGFFVVIGVIGSALYDKSDDKPKKVSTTNPGNATSDTVETEEAKELFAVGETAEYNEIQVSVTGYEKSNGNDFSKPASGREFIYVNVDIANNSDDDLAISSMLSFTAYCDDYKLDFSSDALMALDDRNQLDGTISAGKKMNGYLGLEVPSGWKVIELQFTDNVWTSSKVKFEIKSN